MRVQGHIHACPHIHTHISLPVTLSCLRITLMNWTARCGEAVRCMFLLLLCGDIAEDPLQVCPTLWAEVVFVCVTFSSEKNYAYMIVDWEPGGNKKHTAKMTCDVWRCFLFHFYYNKIFTELMPSILVGVRYPVSWQWAFVKKILHLHPLWQSQYTPPKFKLEISVLHTKHHWSITIIPVSLILSKFGRTYRNNFSPKWNCPKNLFHQWDPPLHWRNQITKIQVQASLEKQETLKLFWTTETCFSPR